MREREQYDGGAGGGAGEAGAASAASGPDWARLLAGGGPEGEPPGADGRGDARSAAARLGEARFGEARLGERATLVQFSTAFCRPCRATRHVLDQIAALVPGVAHVEIDAEEHLALVRAARIEATPTVLFLDAAGHEVRRASGAPRRDQVLGALARML